MLVWPPSLFTFRLELAFTRIYLVTRKLNLSDYESLISCYQGSWFASRTRVLPSPLDCLVAYLNLEWAARSPAFCGGLWWRKLELPTMMMSSMMSLLVVDSSFSFYLCILSSSGRMCWRTAFWVAPEILAFTRIPGNKK